jgi:hypothetical protein
MSKTWTRIAALVAGAATAGAAQAQAPSRAGTPGGFEVGAEVFDYSYRERFEGETVAFDDGALGGLRLDYVETIGSGLFLRARLSGATGSIDYRSPDPAGDVRLENVSQSVGQLELQIGLDFPLGGGATISPFTGIASRALVDESGGKVSKQGLAGYDRDIRYGYIPFGAALRVPLGGRGSAVTFSAQYDLVVHGTAESKFSGIDPALPDVKLDLDGGHGLEASIAYRMPLGRHAVSFGPFVRHWRLDRSKSFTLANPDDPTETLELFEPRNRTTEAGLRLTFAF